MNLEILKFLNKYSSNVQLINKLLVSLFLNLNNLTVKKNYLIKSLLITHTDDEYEIFNDFINLYNKHDYDIDFGKLIQLFEHSIPGEDRTTNGIVYTPKNIKSFIINEVFRQLEKSPENTTFCDLSCGCGGFLYTIAKKLRKITNKSFASIFRKNLYGLDIKDYSISRSKILLSLLAISEGEDNISFEFNLPVGNALDFDWFNYFSKIYENSGFDCIVGNPPYVTLRNIDTESRLLLKNWSVANDGNTDLYIPFFEIGIKYLKENGILGYITVNSFFRTLNARSLRKFFQTRAYEFKIIDFGNAQLFGNNSTYTCLCFIQKQNCDRIKYAKAMIEDIDSSNSLNYDEIKYKSLDYLRGWVLCSESIIKKLKVIESTGQKLIKRYKMRTGLATLANHIYIFKPISEDEDFFYLKSKDRVYSIEKKICRDIINPNKIKLESDIPFKIQKIIFPYFIKEDKVDLFNEDYFESNFTQAYNYLKEQRDILSKRDKGQGKYKNWYAFGRNQSLTDRGYKLLFPHITTHPNFIFTDHQDLLFYNGHAIYSNSKEELIILKKILESLVFDFYINNSSKPYNNGYFSLSKNYIKHFGLCELMAPEKDFLLNCNNLDEINLFLLKKYGLDLSEESRKKHWDMATHLHNESQTISDI